MKDILVVFIGGGLGSIARYSLGRWVNTYHTSVFPWGTFVVNLSACLLIGIILGMADQKQMLSPTSRLFWTVGFAGGFSTFSAFGAESLQLLHSGHTATMLLYVTLSLVIGVAAIFGGMVLVGK